MAMLDFTRQQRVRQNLPSNKQPTRESTLSDSEWSDKVGSLELPVQYACACPLTDDELETNKIIPFFEREDTGRGGDRLACRFRDGFTAWDAVIPLHDVPEIELALQAMLVCSLEEAACLPKTELRALQKLVQSYWNEVMSVFSACVDEIRVSTCAEIEAYRGWWRHIMHRQSIFLIPIGDANHTRARFYAYPEVWEVFATVFGPQYQKCISFYCNFPNAEPPTNQSIWVSRAAAAEELHAADLAARSDGRHAVHDTLSDVDEGHP
jgi:hypothetical protein